MTRLDLHSGPAGRRVRQPTVLRAAALLVAGAALSACGAGGGTSKASGSDRAATAGVCVNVGVRLGAQSVTPAQAKARLQPILAKVSAVAQQNAALPVGPKLQSLADAITKVENANPTMASQLRSAASDIGSAAKGVLGASEQVAQ